MSRRLLEPGERATESVRRIVRRETRKALESLPSNAPSPDDETVHDARKRIKRARAALRLVRRPLGKKRYRRENEALRDAARPLSAVRDANVLVDAFDRLVGAAARGGRSPLRSVRDALVRDRFRIFRRQRSLESTRKALEAVRRRARRWPLGHRSWPALESGLLRVYEAGRKQLAKVRRDPSDSNLHELRKQAKYLWQQLEILEPLSPEAIRTMARNAHQLSDYLGEDHDLAVLRVRLSRHDGRALRGVLPAVQRRILRAREELRAKALAVGDRVYAPDPRELSERLERRWHAWRRKRA